MTFALNEPIEPAVRGFTLARDLPRVGIVASVVRAGVLASCVIRQQEFLQPRIERLARLAQVPGLDAINLQPVTKHLQPVTKRGCRS